MEWEFLIGLGAITLAVIAVVIFLGMKLNRIVQSKAADSDLAKKLTLTGTALFAGMVGFWLICLVAGQLRPASSLGAFVNTTDGKIAVVVGSIFFVVIVGEILRKLGYPSFRDGDDR